MSWRRWAGNTVAGLGLIGCTACALPPRGALYNKLVAPAPVAAAAPSGASLAQYYTLGAFRVADQLASASNSLDDGLVDRQQGLISAAYLTLVAERSNAAAQSAIAEANQLSPPPEIRSQAATFYAAAVALASAVNDTQQALDASNGGDTATLLAATERRRAAAQTLETEMTTLESVSWGQPDGSAPP